ncbi:MAG: Gfo/Idh/MocA family protein [Pseudomonadota bacterium]
MPADGPISPLKMAVVGAGLMGRWHLHAARRLGARPVAIVDADSTRARSLAKGLRGVAAFPDTAAMLAACAPDVVHVCTPLATHRTIAGQIIAAGHHALVEKPLTPTAGETRDLLALAQGKGVLLRPVHQFAMQDGVARAKAALPSLGAVRHISFAIASAGGEGLAGTALSAIVADILPHPLAVLRALWPEAPLTAAAWPVDWMGPGEFFAAGQFIGARLDIAISMQARPTLCALTIRCDKGSLKLNFFHGYGLVQSGAVSRWRKLTQPFTLAGKTLAAASGNLVRRGLRGEPAYPGLRRLIGDFYAAARGAAPPPFTPADIIAIAEARDQLLAKARL